VSGHAQQLPTQQPPRQPTYEESDDLDVPDFLK
jgi:cell division protein FtsZ